MKSNDIWTPDIVIIDSAEDKLPRDYKENYLLIVHHSGQVRWQFQVVSRSSCKIDIRHFPFDEQRCSIKLRSSARDKNSLMLIKRNERVKLKDNIKTEWFILKSSVKESELVQHRNTSHHQVFSILEYELVLRRNVFYYFIKIILPFSLIALIVKHTSFFLITKKNIFEIII